MSTGRFRLRGFGRIAIAAVTAGLAATALVACGNDSGATESAQVTGADPAAFPRTLDTAMGQVTIPRVPARIVVLDTAELDSVTLLGIRPVGAVVPHTKTRGGFPEYLASKVDGVTDVGPLLEPNLERIASLRPDLILSSKVRHEKIYDKLSGIAPTVFTETTGGPWKANLAVHGKALGLEQQAAQALRAYEDRARALGVAIASANNGVLPSVSVVRFLAGPTRLYQSNSFSGVVLADIGLPRPASQVSTDPKKIMKEVSPEQIDQADAQLIFVATIDDPGKTEKNAVTAGRVWQDLAAVKSGKVFEVPDETWMSGIGVQAADRMLADVATATGVGLPGK
ncbi:iron complex transport system substrate-binding protein [Nocardia amikacinitolerans]|uniref:ABC transporter substrate-binding protein n=1 Tax=Nocardia amikacinitolerans TaxID=756689 RepID=UPI00082B683B|nr:iron-siderophore ABC transporter substrate-binding protein [Nocardia amikacinitolerans]MCP2319181.1 iron complex transport system substrate-binding protein [Nocardia amikacinitolerans]